MNEIWYKIKVLCASLLVFTLFTIDICTWSTGILLYNETCVASPCLKEWFLFTGLLSMYINFFRLFDLVQLYVAVSDESATINQYHFAGRVLFEVCISIFHLVCFIIGCLVLDQTAYLNEFLLQKQYVANLIILVLCARFCYFAIGVYVAWLKCNYLKVL